MATETIILSFTKIYRKHVLIADPAKGLVKLKIKDFLFNWTNSNDFSQKGICLFLETTPYFYENKDEKSEGLNISFLFKYLLPYKKFLIQLVYGMLIVSLAQLAFPFLTQAIVDIGIKKNNLGIIYLILIAQVILIFSRSISEFIRSWIFLHMSTRVNVSLISDYLIKLMKLSIGFFDSKMVGDLIQRIDDHERVEEFLTSTSIKFVIALINIIVFSIVLGIYNLNIFMVFLLGSVIYLIWISLIQKKRKPLDYMRFETASQNNNGMIQLFQGMQEIKLNSSENQKRWEWESIQAKLFKINIKSLLLEQYQRAGSILINEIKNVIVTIITAKSVIQGDMSLGMMLSIQYIIGQLISPIDQMMEIFHSIQDTKISLERLNEVHLSKSEDYNKIVPTSSISSSDITISDLSFQYEGPYSPKVLSSVSFIIPKNKVTAIVGASGSGKTTLIKLILGFYEISSGSIKIGNTDINQLNKDYWRRKCGVVMQEGYIFSDTIAKNIAVGEDELNEDRLNYSLDMVNMSDFIFSLPLKLNTIIGKDGIGLSQGQKQRILLARAIYKNPDYIFLDEATNALDANNEKVIIDNLNKFFKGKTVVVVAHRLSTVKDADNILVLDKGVLVESGNHQSLVSKKGNYYNLVKNQLELGM
jgi:ATP-binding cassette subfamily B protein